MNSVRPLTGIALKSCLDTLRPHIAGAKVLDLFAGEGRFGLGCLKENAQNVVLVEMSRRQCQRLVKTGARVIEMGAQQFLGQSSELFDIIFADPPFPIWNEAFWKDLAKRVSSHLLPKGIFLVKSPARMLFSLDTFELKVFKESKFGESRLSYLSHLELVL